MKNVLVLAHDDSGQEARLQAALDLTRALSGHLNCVDVTPLPLVADTALGAGPGSILYDEADSEAANAERLQRRLAGEDVAWSFEARRGEFSACLAGAMRAADLVVLNRGAGRFPTPDMRIVIGNLLIESDVIAVAVSSEERGFPISGPALVAWDGSAAAMNAVQRAVPLLGLAEKVTVIQIGELPEDATPAEEAASYLARHGIKPEIEVLPAAKSIAAEIVRAAERIGAGYCVMGVYGHSRLREAVFGGVTRDLLGSDGLPLVLGH